MRARGRGAALAWVGAVTVAMAGGARGSGDAGLSVAGRALLAGTTVPAPMQLPNDASYCPPVSIMQGGALLQNQRTVITLGQLARECTLGPDGSTIVKVGVEGRLVLGSSSGGRHDVPLRFAITRGTDVVVSRVRRASVALGPAETFSTFALVEEGILVPAAAARDFEIEVGLGGSAPAVTRRR